MQNKNSSIFPHITARIFCVLLVWELLSEKPIEVSSRYKCKYIFTYFFIFSVYSIPTAENFATVESRHFNFFKVPKIPVFSRFYLSDLRCFAEVICAKSFSYQDINANIIFAYFFVFILPTRILPSPVPLSRIGSLRGTPC